MKQKQNQWLVYYLTMITLAIAIVGYVYIAYAMYYPVRQQGENLEHIYTVDDTVYRLLRKYQGVSYNKVDRIVKCESGWNPNAKNRQSTASGYAQFLFSTWYHEVIEQLGWSNLISPFDGERNLEGLIFLLNEGEDWRWSSSYACWST